jgi:hypothetical protein
VKSWIILAILGMAAACSGSTTPTMQTNAPRGSPSANAAKAPDENVAVDTLHKITEAQSTYFKLNRRYALTYDELVDAHLLSSEPSAVQTGYEFKLRPAADAQTYRITVVPADSGFATARQFFTDQTGVIRAEAGKEASASSPEVK